MHTALTSSTRFWAPEVQPGSVPGPLVTALVDQGVILGEEWEDVPEQVRIELRRMVDYATLLPALVGRHLLTRFQADAIRAARTADLTIGQYRILEPLGHGGMGVVYRAEHRHLRRPVAIKVMSEQFSGNSKIRDRFHQEARAVARLQHPNIVACLDAGEERRGDRGPTREYFVMDLVPGADLQDAVSNSGPLPVHRAADLFRQAAEALAEAHRIGLIHRDIKPSNIIVTPDWKAKILDFGLARNPACTITEPGVILGTVGYMSPEQARDATAVDARADLYGLGASLFFTLTGVEPFESIDSTYIEIGRRLTSDPPHIRRHRPELPIELDELVAKLMAPDRAARYPSATAAAAALIPFTRWRPESSGTVSPSARKPRVLIVDDDPDVREYLRSLLDADYDCREAGDGRAGIELIEANRFDLVIVDQEMPRMDGAKFITKIHQVSAWPGPMVLYMSGRVPTESLGGLLLAGADDFIRKPFTDTELLSRVRGVLNRRASRVGGKKMDSPSASVVTAGADGSGLLVDGMSRLLEQLGVHNRGYAARLQGYLTTLASRACNLPQYSRLGDGGFLRILSRVAAVHDIGLATVPTAILTKPGGLEPDERLVMQMHTTTGADMLASLVDSHPEAQGLNLAAEIARSHHENWDGSGYPDGLVGEAIPLVARITAIAATYDSLRNRRAYRPGLSHSRAVRVMTIESQGMFDPGLLAVFSQVADQMDLVFTNSNR